MNLPPKIRAIQQTTAYHALQAALVGTGATLFTCFQAAHGFTHDCLMTFIFATGATFFVSMQHSPNSDSFHTDGTPNKAVEQVAAVTKPMPADIAVAAVDVVKTDG